MRSADLRSSLRRTPSREADELNALSDAKVSIIIISASNKLQHFINLDSDTKEIYDAYQQTSGIDLWSSHYKKKQEDLHKLNDVNHQLQKETRVISRGDDGDPINGDDRVPRSKDLEGVLGMESAVVIFDDFVKVWPHNKLNSIVVERQASSSGDNLGFQSLHSLKLTKMRGRKM